MNEIMFGKVKTKSNTHKVKFVILSTARTGSNFLISLINTRIPSCFSYGELFNLSSLSESEFRNCLNDPVNYLNGKIEDKLDDYTAVGLKMFYYHATKVGFGNNVPFLLPYSPKIAATTDEILKRLVTDYNLAQIERKFSELWNYLRDSSCRIIHLKRNNLLRSYISLKNAYITDKWVGITPHQGEKLYFSYEECVDYFQKTTDYEKKYEKYFEKNLKITVIYEELVHNEKLVLQQLADFLHCEEPSTIHLERKKNEILLTDMISNYSELKAKLEGTTWERYFIED